MRLKRVGTNGQKQAHTRPGVCGRIRSVADGMPGDHLGEINGTFLFESFCGERLSFETVVVVSFDRVVACIRLRYCKGIRTKGKGIFE